MTRLFLHYCLLVVVSLVYGAIDRRAVVSRHDIHLEAANAKDISACDVLSVGNGAFVFNVDISGMQTFNDTYATGRCSFDTNTMVGNMC